MTICLLRGICLTPNYIAWVQVNFENCQRRSVSWCHILQTIKTVFHFLCSLNFKRISNCVLNKSFLQQTAFCGEYWSMMLFLLLCPHSQTNVQLFTKGFSAANKRWKSVDVTMTEQCLSSCSESDTVYGSAILTKGSS